MTRRELPRSEWARLAGTELAPAIAADVFPADTRLVVVEDDAGAIVGAWAVIRYVHVEGLWIAPTHRGRGRVLRHLLAGMRDVARSWGAAAVWTAAQTADVARLIVGYGGRQFPTDIDHFVMPIEKGQPCR